MSSAAEGVVRAARVALQHWLMMGADFEAVRPAMVALARALEGLPSPQPSFEEVSEWGGRLAAQKELAGRAEMRHARCVERIAALETDRDEQKARADRAAADAIAWMGKHAYADARIAALEKAGRAFLDHALEARILGDRERQLAHQLEAALDASKPAGPNPDSVAELERAYAAFWAALLDATQPKDSTFGEPAGTLWQRVDQQIANASLSAEYAQLRKDVTTLAQSMVDYGVCADDGDLLAIIQRGQARTPNNLWSNPAPTSPDVEQLKTSLTDLKLTPEQIEERREAAKERVRSLTESGHVRTQPVPWDVGSVTGKKARGE